jgi:endonuclease YncB( thermonuclease family)
VQVVAVTDGDTIELRNGKRVRLVQIDAPEAGGECYGSQATGALSGMVAPGTRVVLERDPALTMSTVTGGSCGTSTRGG